MLAPLLWPKNRKAQASILLAFCLLAASRLLALGAPLLYKDTIDSLTGPVSVNFVPWVLILAYGVARLSMQVSDSLRVILFNSVLMRATHAVRVQLFSHLLSLSLRYHLDRQTGGVNLVITRGVLGMEIVLRNLLFSVAPN